MCVYFFASTCAYCNVLNEKSYLNKFGAHLRLIRISKSLSQEHLAIDADIPTNQIGRIERGEISTTITTLLKIATALDMDVKDFFDFEYNRN